MRIASRSSRIRRLPANPAPDGAFDELGTASAADLLEFGRLSPSAALVRVGTSDAGLSEIEATIRLSEFGLNRQPATSTRSIRRWLWASLASPFTALLLALDLFMLITSDLVGVALLSAAVAASLVIGLRSEHRFDHITTMLTDLSMPRTTVQRRPGRGRFTHPVTRRRNTRLLVPGDMILLEPGDTIPADCRLITTDDLTVDQAVLTGESTPVVKYATPANSLDDTLSDVLHTATLCLTGSSVATGHATALVIKTGPDTQLAATVRQVAAPRTPTAADLGLRAVTWLLIRLLGVLVPVVFVLTAVAGHGTDLADAALFAVAVAVGLVPELLPVILAAAHARGLSALAARKIIVTRPAAVRDLAGMDVLCTDKTGTLTSGRLHLDTWLNPNGAPDPQVLEYALLAAAFSTDPHNRLDAAILDHATPLDTQVAHAQYERIGEIGFDATRRRASVILDPGTDDCLLITKGAVTDVLAACTRLRTGDTEAPLTDADRERLAALCAGWWADGRRLLAIAYRSIDPDDDAVIDPGWETELTLIGFCGFTDPAKPGVAEAIDDLAGHGVRTVIVTGDATDVALALCTGSGITAGTPITGTDIDTLDEATLTAIAAQTTVFSEVNPLHKARIVRALRAGGHVVGFLGDGVNDTAALRAADIGLAVTDAVPVARYAADAVLLDKDLRVLADGVVAARHATLNATKYLKATLSANLGNVLSVLYAAIALPFLPMLPLQLLVQNVCYDLVQLTLPFDRTDPEQLRTPQQWSSRDLLIFVACFAPLSSVFDVATFALLGHLMNLHSAAGQVAFHTGWFIESLLTQILAVHVIRTGRIPLLRSCAAAAVVLAAVAGCALALAMPATGIGARLGFTPLHAYAVAGIGMTVLAYLVALQAGKVVYRRFTRRWL
jgi:P-type Mg2+ transporter